MYLYLLKGGALGLFLLFFYKTIYNLAIVVRLGNFTFYLQLKKLYFILQLTNIYFYLEGIFGLSEKEESIWKKNVLVLTLGGLL